MPSASAPLTFDLAADAQLRAALLDSAAARCREVADLIDGRPAPGGYGDDDLVAVVRSIAAEVDALLRLL